MNRQIPNYQPPSRDTMRAASFPEYLKQLEEYLTRLNKYNQDFFNQYVVPLLNSGAQGFPTTNVASAATINITAYTTVITGTTTISTIHTTPDFSGQIHLYSQDGFATNALGNISAAKTVAIGQGALLDYNPIKAKWTIVISG